LLSTCIPCHTWQALPHQGRPRSCNRRAAGAPAPHLSSRSSCPTAGRLRARCGGNVTCFSAAVPGAAGAGARSSGSMRAVTSSKRYHIHFHLQPITHCTGMAHLCMRAGRAVRCRRRSVAERSAALRRRPPLQRGRSHSRQSHFGDGRHTSTACILAFRDTDPTLTLPTATLPTIDLPFRCTIQVHNPIAASPDL